MNSKMLVKGEEDSKMTTTTTTTWRKNSLGSWGIVFLTLGVSMASIAVLLRQKQQRVVDDIVRGHLTLVDIQVATNGLAHGTNRYKVEATFCEIDWELQKKNPSSVSFFSGLMEQSKSCASTMQTFDLYDLVQTLLSHDQQASATMRSISPTGVIFHESRCGSTLAANILAAFAPRKTRVYSEHFAPMAALKACAEQADCNHDLHWQLIRDVYYVLGRSPVDSGLEYVFYKTNSGGLYIDKFTAVFPDTPWAYMFRDSHEIMQSHCKLLDSAAPDSEQPELTCARLYRNPHQPPTTLAVLERANKTYTQLDPTEYCAAHLASISLSVRQEHQRSGKGRFINYQQMPNVMWETLLPIDFGIPVEQPMVENMVQFSKVYSKGHQQGRANEQWTSDTDRKRQLISPNVTRAVQMFCPDTYEQLERISQQQQSQSL